MKRGPRFTYKNGDELAQAIISLACLIKEEAIVAEHRAARHTTTLERLQACAFVAMGNHDPETFVHQVLAHIADATDAKRPKLSVVLSQ